MPLDHYVSQVHLRKFYSPVLKNRLHVIRKDDLRTYTQSARNLCRIESGNTNPFLVDAQGIEKFLAKIEPYYNTAVENLAVGRIDGDSVCAIAGFVAYVSSCSPAAMRMHGNSLKRLVETSGEIIERQGRIPSPPPELGVKSLAEIFERGLAKVEVKPKYPQALGAATIVRRTLLLSNFDWELICNYHDRSPFFTSDFPTVMEATPNPWVKNHIVPLTPKLAIRIKPDPLLRGKSSIHPCQKFRWRKYRVSDKELRALNRLIVQGAESEVYFRDNQPWIRPFVQKNSRYRSEIQTEKLRTERETLHISQMKIVKRDLSSS